MKNQRNFLQTINQHSKRIVTTTVLAGTLILPWNAAEAEPSAFANFNDDESRNLFVSAPSEHVSLAMLSQVNPAAVTIRTSPATATRAAAVQLFSDVARSGLQTHAFTPTSLHQPALGYVNLQKPEFAVNDDASWVMFSR
jgi:hypothetical protein